LQYAVEKRATYVPPPPVNNNKVMVIMSFGIKIQNQQRIFFFSP
jgi:hypothetical protein